MSFELFKPLLNVFLNIGSKIAPQLPVSPHFTFSFLLERMKEFLHFERMKCFSTHVQTCLLLTTFPPPICSIFLALSSHTLTTVSRISPLGKKHYILSTPNIILSIIKLFENIVYCFFHLLTPTLYPSIHCNLVLLFLHFNFFLKILDLHIAKYNKLFTNSLSRLPYYNIGNVFSRNSLLPCLL